SAKFLKGPLGRRERFILASPSDRQVGFQKRIAAIADESIGLRSIPLQVIEKDTADPARLPPMREKKIFVTPLLEARVVRHRRMPITDLLPDAMEMNDILAIGVIRGQIGAVAEPLLAPFG